MVEATDADDASVSELGREMLTVIAECGIASERKLLRKTDATRNELRAESRTLERAGLLIAEGRDSLAYNVVKYAVTTEGDRAADAG